MKPPYKNQGCMWISAECSSVRLSVRPPVHLSIILLLGLVLFRSLYHVCIFSFSLHQFFICLLTYDLILQLYLIHSHRILLVLHYACRSLLLPCSFNYFLSIHALLPRCFSSSYFPFSALSHSCHHSHLISSSALFILSTSPITSSLGGMQKSAE